MRVGLVIRSKYKPGRKKSPLPQLRRIEVIAHLRVKAEFRDSIHLGIDLNADHSVKMIYFFNKRPGHGGETEALFYFHPVKRQYEFANMDEDHQVMARLSVIAKRLSVEKKHPALVALGAELATAVDTYHTSHN